MKALITKNKNTGLYEGEVIGVSGTHCRAKTLEELKLNLSKTLDMILERKTIEEAQESVFMDIMDLPPYAASVFYEKRLDK